MRYYSVNFPQPTNEEFRTKVLVEIANATLRARETIKIYGANPWAGSRKTKPLVKTRKPLVKTRKKMNGVCKGCGGHYDDYTRGCSTCMYRHSDRRWVKKRRLRARN
jgi:hypothetical protein